MTCENPLIYYEEGRTKGWEVTGSFFRARTLKKAVSKLCKKLKLEIPSDIPKLAKAERFGLYYVPDHSATNIMCGEEYNESLFGVREIDFFENGDWLIQYCPLGKSFLPMGSQ